MPEALKIAVLIGGSGRTLQNFLDQKAAGDLNVQVRLVIASRAGLLGTERAMQHGLQHEIIDRRTFADSTAASDLVFERCDAAGVALVCLAGWLSLLDVPSRYHGRVMNIHPALLPSFGGRGMFGIRVHQAVIDRGCKISGCTVHFVDASYDQGPIILQRVCSVHDNDDAHALADRVFDEEKRAFPEAIRLFATGRLRIDGQRVRIID